VSQPAIQTVSRTAHQPTLQARIHQPVGHAEQQIVSQPVNQTVTQPVSWTAHQPTLQPRMHQAVHLAHAQQPVQYQPVLQTVDQYRDDHTLRSAHHVMGHPVQQLQQHQAVHQIRDPHVHQSVSQATHQTIEQPLHQPEDQFMDEHQRASQVMHDATNQLAHLRPIHQPAHQSIEQRRVDDQQLARGRLRENTPVTLVVSDSMCAGIRDKEINAALDAHSLTPGAEHIKVERHLGATASEIRYYSKYNIQMLQPSSIIVVAGANDITAEIDAAQPDAANVAHRIGNIARDAKELGVPTVFVMGIVSRRDRRYESITAEVNLGLRYICSQEGFHFIDNQLIHNGDLQRDGLHVNFEGKKKLMHGIMSSCSSYNPTYGYMWNNLNKWGISLNS